MARIYKRGRGGLWGDYYTPEGRRVRTSLRTNDRKVAKERLRQAELAATPKARGRKERLSEAIDQMIALMHDRAEGTREMYREKGRRLHESMGDPCVSDIDHDMVSNYIRRRLSAETGHGGAHPHTIKKELITIGRALRGAHERGVLVALPALPKFSPKYTPKETWLTVEQFEALCAELPAKRQLWVSLAALGGFRSSEVERLDWTNLELKLMRVPGTKTSDSRRPVPIAPALAHRLAQIPEGERTGCVVEAWGNVRRDLHAACVRAKVPKISPNDLRRTFASWLVQQGVPLLTVATLLGHKSTRMVERVYGRLSRTNLDAAIALLPGFTTNAPKEKP